ncbi:hypothetical protein KAR34_02840, partial [bacterium]|nr:hypothetical protein [bacterium]
KVELPWLNLITWSPVMVIHPQNPKRDLKSWRFTVLDRNKTILYLQEGNAPLPKKIAWDGKKRDGDRIGIGELFYYGMHLVDRSGQTLSTNSRPKKINSLAYIQNQDLYIHMLNELLFEEAEGKIFSELGTSLLRESCSAVIRHMGKKVYVNVRVRKQAVGESQGNGIKLFILQRLQLPGEDIEVTVEIVPATIAEQVTLVVRH